MKIALFFLIVGLSGCFAGNENECQLKMDEAQAYGCGWEVIRIILFYYHQKNNMTPCSRNCFWHKIIFCLELLSGATGCPYDVIAAIVINCVTGVSQKTREDAMKGLRNKDPAALENSGLTLIDLMRAVVCTLSTVLHKQGYILSSILRSIFLELALVLIGIGDIIEFVIECGLDLDLSLLDVNGQQCVVYGDQRVPVGAEVECAPENMEEFQNNMLWPHES